MPTLMELLDAGVHFGHKKERSHPKMKDYTFSLREGVFIIDLDKTREAIKTVLEFLKQEIASGKTILFVGTKRQAKDIVKETATHSGMPYIVHRWLGGTLTNYETLRRSITEMERLENLTKSPEYAAITKKERKIMADKILKLETVFGGIKDMKKLPDVVFVVDAHREQLAIDEATRMGIPVVAMADTDTNPKNIDYIIPANDDSVKSIELIMKTVSSVLGGVKVVKVAEKSEEKIESLDIARDKDIKVENVAELEAEILAVEEPAMIVEEKKAEPEVIDVKAVKAKKAPVKKVSKEKK